jgi:D-alanine-D-alanine ligase
VAMDKSYTKVILGGAGLPVLPYTAFRLRDWERDPAVVTESVTSLGYPVFVKPARGGSSLGISKVEGPDGLPAAVAKAAGHDPKIIVDAGVEGGRELEIGVLGGLDGRPECSPIAEIELGEGVEFYDFDTKYLASEEQVRLTLPADIPPAVADRITELALAAFEALDVEGLARVDFFLTAAGEVLINEVNTMPGFTPMSMFPRMWLQAGMDYSHLLDRLLDLAVQRGPGLR